MAGILDLFTRREGRPHDNPKAQVLDPGYLRSPSPQWATISDLPSQIDKSSSHSGGSSTLGIPDPSIANKYQRSLMTRRIGTSPWDLGERMLPLS